MVAMVRTPIHRTDVPVKLTVAVAPAVPEIMADSPLTNSYRPLLLQLPIWAALFTTLRTSYDLYGEPFVGPVWTDLTHKDPTYLFFLDIEGHADDDLVKRTLDLVRKKCERLEILGSYPRGACIES